MTTKAETMALALESEELCESTSSPLAESPARRHLRRTGLAGIPLGIVLAVLGWLLPIQNPILTRLSFGTLTTVLGVTVVLSSIWGVSMMNRIRLKRLTSARIVPEGVEGRLADGTVLLARWSDPLFALEIDSVPPSLQRGWPPFGLRWQMERSAYPGGLTAAGHDRLVEEARAHGLRIIEITAGTGPNVWKTFQLRHPASNT